MVSGVCHTWCTWCVFTSAQYCQNYYIRQGKGQKYERNTFKISLMIFFSSLYLALRSSTKNLNKSSGVDPKNEVVIITKRLQLKH